MQVGLGYGFVLGAWSTYGAISFGMSPFPFVIGLSAVFLVLAFARSWLDSGTF